MLRFSAVNEGGRALRKPISVAVAGEADGGDLFFKRRTVIVDGPDPIDQHVGGQLRLRRAQAGLTQTELGNKVGLSFQAVQKYESGENQPGLVVFKRIFAAAYDWHNYSNLPIGARSDIENVPITRLQAFYHKFYQPDNAVLVLTGRLDEAKVVFDRIENAFVKPDHGRAIGRSRKRRPGGGIAIGYGKVDPQLR